MNKKEDATDDIDFDFIFKNTANVQVIEEQIVKLKKRNQIIVAVCVMLILSFFSIHGLFLVSKRDFIEGNVLKIAFDYNEDSDVPFLNPWENVSFIGEVLFRSLFVTNSTFTDISPELAESFYFSSDDLTYTITLKDGLKWSDGVDLTVDDITFSIHACILNDDVNPNLKTAFSKISGYQDFINGTTSHLSGISTYGNTISIKLSSHYSSFLIMLTQFVPLPMHILQDVDPIKITKNNNFFTIDNIVCNGMYVPDTINREGNIILLQNPYYEDKCSDIQQIIGYSDWKNEEIDYFYTNDITQMVTFRGLNNYSEFVIDDSHYHYFCYNVVSGTHASNLLVRQAVNHAIDIESLFNDLYLASGHLIYSGVVDVTEQVYEYNPSLAKELLTEANYNYSTPYVIAYSQTDQTFTIFLEKVVHYLGEIGMNVELLLIPLDEIFENTNYDMCFKGLSAFSIEDWYREYNTKNNKFSTIFGDTTVFDTLLNELTSTSSQNNYNVILNSLIQLEQDLLYKLPLFTLSQSVFVNTNRISLPNDIAFSNTRFRSELLLETWSIKKQ